MAPEPCDPNPHLLYHHQPHPPTRPTLNERFFGVKNRVQYAPGGRTAPAPEASAGTTPLAVNTPRIGRWGLVGNRGTAPTRGGAETLFLFKTISKNNKSFCSLTNTKIHSHIVSFGLVMSVCVECSLLGAVILARISGGPL